ncbi:hypothetical protein V8C86DRAFT_3098360 [Haematococcus lacustris]
MSQRTEPASPDTDDESMSHVSGSVSDESNDEEGGNGEGVAGDTGRQLPDELRRSMTREKFPVEGLAHGVFPKLTRRVSAAMWLIPMLAVIGYVYAQLEEAGVAYLHLITYWMLVAAYKR